MTVDPQPLDTTVRIVTPENIEFEYRLAGPFSRLLAFLIDLAIRFAFVFAIFIVSLFIPGVGFGLAPVILVLWFFLEWFYGGVFETIWNGMTPGKWALGLRTISVNGKPITALQAILRNILRLADLMPMVMLGSFFGASSTVPIPIPTGMVGLITMSLTHGYRRLGDVVCGTMVVVEQRQWMPGVIQVGLPEVVSLASMLPPTFHPSRSLAKAIAHYMERRSRFSPLRRREIAVHLRDALISKHAIASSVDPDLLIQALYYRAYIADRGQDVEFMATVRTPKRPTIQSSGIEEITSVVGDSAHPAGSEQ